MNGMNTVAGRTTVQSLGMENTEKVETTKAVETTKVQEKNVENKMPENKTENKTVHHRSQKDKELDIDEIKNACEKFGLTYELNDGVIDFKFEEVSILKGLYNDKKIIFNDGRKTASEKMLTYILNKKLKAMLTEKAKEKMKEVIEGTDFKVQVHLPKIKLVSDDIEIKLNYNKIENIRVKKVQEKTYEILKNTIDKLVKI